MFSYEERMRAVTLYYKYDNSISAVIKELGYPSKSGLTRWVDEFRTHGDLRKGRPKMYSLEERQKAVDYYLEHGRNSERTRRIIGYPTTDDILKKWIDELAPGQRLIRETPQKFDENTKLIAVMARELKLANTLQISRALNTARNNIYRWRHELLEMGVTSVLDKRDLPDDPEKLIDIIDDLQKQIKKLELKKDILEGTVELLGKGQSADPGMLTNREKAILVNELRSTHQLQILLKELSFARSSYQYQLEAMARPDKYADLREKICVIFAESRNTYGYRRIHAQLASDGHVVSEKVVARLMAEGGLVVCQRRRRKRFNSFKGDPTPAPPNHVNREFHADEPNRLWLTDITEFSIPAGKVYLSPILDCYLGNPIAWSIAKRPDREFANSSLLSACERLGANEKPCIHSDQGIHYRWLEWIEICDRYGLKRSMSSKGCCPDNAAMEGFFGRLKLEFFYGRNWASYTLEQFMDELDDYLHWYNEHRIKSTLGYVSPQKYLESNGLVA